MLLFLCDKLCLIFTHCHQQRLQLTNHDSEPYMIFFYHFFMYLDVSDTCDQVYGRQF